MATASTLNVPRRRDSGVMALTRKFLGSLRFRVVPEAMVIFLLALVIASFVAKWIMPFPALRGDPDMRLLAPDVRWDFWNGHIMGTDQQGRDIFSRIVTGARYSFQVSFVAIGIGAPIGAFVGMVSGYFAGKVDLALQRVVETTLSIPTIFVGLLLVGIFGPSMTIVSITLAISLWAGYARFIRAQTLSLRGQDFIKMAKVSGAGSPRIILKHILPHVASTFLVIASIQVGGAILAEAGLSFLGAGVPAPLPSWGAMANDGRAYIRTAWWVAVFPGTMIAVIVLCFNMLGDWVRDKLDPRLQ